MAGICVLSTMYRTITSFVSCLSITYKSLSKKLSTLSLSMRRESKYLFANRARAWWEKKTLGVPSSPLYKVTSVAVWLSHAQTHSKHCYAQGIQQMYIISQPKRFWGAKISPDFHLVLLSLSNDLMQRSLEAAGHPCRNFSSELQIDDKHSIRTNLC